MRRRVEATGPATARSMWRAYAHTSRWASWAPQIRRVRPSAPLMEGLSGAVEGIGGMSARFVVTAVDEDAGRWSWDVRVGPARLTIHHAVDDGLASIEIEGPAAVVLAYAPIAHVALRRLVERPPPPNDREAPR